jgi:glycosyltransferase involved in cell wall biosynthesis
MKLGLVIYDSLETRSGGYLYDRRLVEKLRERGDQVSVTSLRRRTYARNLLDNFTFQREDPVDVLIQDELCHPSLFLANSRRQRPPIVAIVHHLRSSERRPPWQNAFYAAIERRYLRTADGFIFNSETTRASVTRLTRQSSPHVIATPGGDRLGESRPDQIRARALQASPLRLVALGSVIPGKGLDVLLEALAGLRGEALHLDVVGPASARPEFAEKMRRTASALGLPVTFRGELSDQELESTLRASHAMVLPSYYEGFGIAYLEGMAHGLPALGSRAGAAPGLIRDGVDGFLVDPGDSAGLAERIRELAHDRQRLVGFGLQALERFRSFPTWDETTERARAFLLAMRRP